MKGLALVVLLALLCSTVAAAPDSAAFTWKGPIACGQYRLEYAYREYAETNDVLVRLWTQSGKLAFPILWHSGSFESLCDQGSFLLLDTNYQYEPGASFLMSPSGKLIARFDFGYVDDYGSSADDKVFWVQQHGGTLGKPTTTVSVVSFTGKLVAKKIFYKKTTWNVAFDGKTYAIRVIKPDIPG